MNELIPIKQVGGVLVAHSRDIAKSLGILHRSLLETIQTHSRTLEEKFGRVEFQAEPLQTSGGQQTTRFVYLTEPQASFVATLSRNTEAVVQFKAWLVKSFDAAEKTLKPAIDFSDPLIVAQLFIEAEKGRRAAVQKIEELEPKAAFADAVQFGEAAMNIGTFGKIIGVKHIYDRLKALHYIYKRDRHVVPYEKYDQNNQGLFRMRMVQVGEYIHPVTSITGKGQLKIAAELGVTPPLCAPVAGVLQMEARG